jgi:hypothetical protein
MLKDQDCYGETPDQIDEPSEQQRWTARRPEWCEEDHNFPAEQSVDKSAKTTPRSPRR